MPGDKIPGPESKLPGQKPTGLRLENDRLEIPDHYLRDAGMESYSTNLWQSLLASGKASEATDPAELTWWAAGAIEVEANQELDEMAWQYK
eukprot:symbB.v1.2.023466.t1/scaffold2148.1/size153101/4